MDCDEVGQSAAHPAVGDIGLPGAGGFGGHGFLSLALGADEQYLAAAGHGFHQLVVRGAEQLHGLLKIDNVNAVAGAENEGTHLGIPAAGLMAEMHARFQHLLHADISHDKAP